MHLDAMHLDAMHFADALSRGGPVTGNSFIRSLSLRGSAREVDNSLYSSYAGVHGIYSVFVIIPENMVYLTNIVSFRIGFWEDAGIYSKYSHIFQAGIYSSYRSFGSGSGPLVHPSPPLLRSR